MCSEGTETPMFTRSYCPRAPMEDLSNHQLLYCADVLAHPRMFLLSNDPSL